jgi:hypothetical protein
LKEGRRGWGQGDEKVLCVPHRKSHTLEERWAGMAGGLNSMQQGEFFCRLGPPAKLGGREHLPHSSVPSSPPWGVAGTWIRLRP